MAPAPAASAPDVIAMPVSPPPPPPAPLPPAVEPVLPYGDAVAARFPAPPVRYETPGLAEGRIEFTSSLELAEALRALSASSRTAGGPTIERLPLGYSERGVAIEALVFTRSAAGDAATLTADAKPTVLLIGGQHGDEPASTEALMIVARQLASGPFTPLLAKLNVIVVPRANPDGAASLERATADGTDLNRDHLLLGTPEAQALAALVRQYRPMVVVDHHEFAAVGPYLEKFGGLPRQDVLVQHAMLPNLPAFVGRAAEEWFRTPLMAALKKAELSADWYYTSSADLADRSVSMGTPWPDTARNVNGLRHAISFLIETRGAGLGHHHIQRRVHAQVTAAASLLASASARAADLQKLRSFVDQDTSAKACSGDIVVQGDLTRTEHQLLLLDPQTGADKPVMVDWQSALALVPRKLRGRPCAYWLSADAGEAVARLRNLGVQVRQLGQPVSVPGNTYQPVVRAGVDTGAPPSKRLDVTMVDSLLDLPAGSYVVPLTQPWAALAIAALEPDTPFSYYANGVIGQLGQVSRLRSLPAGAFVDQP